MQSAINFIVKPKHQLYANTTTVHGIELTTSTSIEDANDVSREAIVIGLPKTYKGDVQIGDEVIVHHNIFRIFYDNKGEAVQSSFYIRENMFFVDQDLVFLRKKDGQYEGIDDNVFIEPIEETDFWHGTREKQHVGIVKYDNKRLNDEQGIFIGDKIVFRRNCEYRFDLQGEKLYRMSNHRILAKLN